MTTPNPTLCPRATMRPTMPDPRLPDSDLLASATRLCQDMESFAGKINACLTALCDPSSGRSYRNYRSPNLSSEVILAMARLGWALKVKMPTPAVWEVEWVFHEETPVGTQQRQDSVCFRSEGSRFSTHGRLGVSVAISAVKALGLDDLLLDEDDSGGISQP